MNYNSLFNLLYSTEILEATKAEIVEKINYPIQESANAEPLVETYLELLDTLVYSTASEALIYNIIDETFSQLDEDFINEVSDEWVKRKVQDSMTARKGAADAANRSVKGGVIGLSQIRRQDQAQSNLEKGQKQAASIQARLDKRTPAAEPKAEAPKPEGAMGKLKSAVGKVKSFVSSIDKGPDYASLSHAIGRKANQDNIGAEKLRQQTTHKAETPQSDEVKAGTTAKTEAPQGDKEQKVEKSQRIDDLRKKFGRTDNSKGESSSVSDAMKAWKKVEKHAKKIQNRLEKDKNNEIGKSLDRAFSNSEKEPKKEKEVVQQKLDFNAPQAEETSKKGEDTPEVTSTTKRRGRPHKNVTSTETPEVTSTTNNDKGAQKDIQRKISTLTDRIASEQDEKKKEKLQKQLDKLRKSIKVNEALSDLVITLLNTNISENCFVEVMEMVAASKVNAEKALKRDEQNAMAVIDDINKDLEAGKPVDPEKVRKAEELRKKKENFENIFNKKFNDNK